MFSILIPTLNNLEYLKICIKSIIDNSKYNHQIIVHVNIGDDGTLDYVRENNIIHTHTSHNVGICKGLNLASTKSINDLLLYSHDDFYFCPDWDTVMMNEINNLPNNKFYFSGSMIATNGQFSLSCGENFKNFNEKKLLSEYKKIKFRNFQGSTWAPHIIHKEYWNKVNGLSEEFFPGSGSDPDLNMKLWNQGIRIFKGLGDSKVYHFDIKTMRKEKKYTGSKSGKLFLMKWKISIKFFKKYYLRSMEDYNGELSEPMKNFSYYFDLLKCKLQYLYLKIIYKNINNLINY